MPDSRFIPFADDDAQPLTKAKATSERHGWTGYQFEYIYALTSLAEAVRDLGLWVRRSR